MTYFYFLFVLLFLSSLLFRNNKRIGIILLFFMAFMCAFRGMNVGSDTENYYNNNFSNIFSLDSEKSYDAEFLFVLLTNTITNFNLNPRWCLFSLSIITLFFLLFSIKRFRINNDVSYVLVAYFFFILDFYPLAFNVARQIAASSIILYAYSFLQEPGKKKYLFFVFIILAASIHLSSLFYALAFIVRNANLEWFSKHIKLTISIAIVLYLVVQLNKSYVLDFFFSHMNIASLYEHLAVETLQSEVSIIGSIFALAEFVTLLVCFRMLYNEQRRTLAVLLFVSVFLTIFLSAFYGNVARLRLGFTIIEPIALASIFSGKLKLTKDKLLLFFALSVVFGYNTISSLANGNYEIIPFYLTF